MSGDTAVITQQTIGVPVPVDAATLATSPARFLNRELSWLDFNGRVLHLAEDAIVPLLERAKFLAIFSTNLDEFFQVRVAGLKDQVAAGLSPSTPDEKTPAEQLLDVRDRVEALTRHQQQLFIEQIVPALAEQGIVFSSFDDLDEDDRKHLDEVFDERIFPVLTPLAVDPGHPFPYISDLSLNLAVEVLDPKTSERRFARVKVPNLLSRFVVMPDGQRFVPLEQVIAAHLGKLFPGMEIGSHHTFRVTRNADLTLEEEDADDLLAAVEMEVRRRRFGRAVRLEIDHEMSDEVRELLQRELDVSDEDVYAQVGPLDLGGLWAIHALDRARSQGRGVGPDRRPTPRESRCRRDQLLQRAPSRRRAGPPSVHVVRDIGRGVHPPGIARPQGLGHQADAVSHIG